MQKTKEFIKMFTYEKKEPLKINIINLYKKFDKKYVDYLQQFIRIEEIEWPINIINKRQKYEYIYIVIKEYLEEINIYNLKNLLKIQLIKSN